MFSFSPPQTRFLAIEFLPPGTDFPIPDDCAIHLEVDCSGSHRAWDFAYVPQDDTLIFAAIRKESLLCARRRVQRARTTHGFTRKCLIVRWMTKLARKLSVRKFFWPYAPSMLFMFCRRVIHPVGVCFFLHFTHGSDLGTSGAFIGHPDGEHIQ